MLSKLLFKLSARLRCRLISLDSGPYLERYYIGQLFGVTFYLHRFVSHDTERHLHNHPWGWGRSIILSGGYVEEYVGDIGVDGPVTATRRVSWYNKVDGDCFHRIGQAKPNTWSLFFHGERQRIRRGMVSTLKGWGFLERQYVVGYHDVTMFVPAEPSTPRWWETAKTGDKVGRVKYAN